MHSLLASSRNETMKLFGRRNAKLTLALAVLVPIAAAFLIGNLESAVGLSLGRDMPMLMLDLFATVLLPLFLFMAAAESFSGEAAARTIKLVLLRPVSRGKVFASKVLALLVYAAVLLAAVWLASVPAGLALDGGAALAGLPNSIPAFAAAFVAMAALCSTAVFVAQWVASGVGALALCVLLYAAAKALPFFFPDAAVWSVFSYTDWHGLWVGDIAPAGSLLQAFAFLMAGCIISYMAGWFLFERKSF